MKILLFSDVHANIDALQALESAEKHWDEAWFLGDMVDYGFHPHEVIAWMREHEVKAVMGNHDRRLVTEWDSGAPCPPPEEAERFIDYDRALVTAEDIAWLRTLPEETRCIFLRRYWYCDATADIAARYGLTESKVRVTLHRTRGKLAAYLQERGAAL